MTMSRPTVAVIGGGYGGVGVAKALDEHVDVVLIEPREAFHHNVAALRALVEPSWLDRIFLRYDGLLANGSVRRDRAVEVDHDHIVLASGARLSPDIIVLATGSTYPFPAKSDHVSVRDAIADYRALYGRLAAADRVMLLGAGAVGLELAGEIAAAWPDKKLVLVDIADEILPGGYDPRLRAELSRQLDELGVDLVLGGALTALPDVRAGELGSFTATTTGGVPITADLWLPSHGVAPNTGYLAGSLAAARTADGYLSVTPELRVSGFDTVFALGDIAAIDANKAGIAGRQAHVVTANIRAHLGDGEPVRWASAPTSIILPLGPGGGAGQVAGREDILTAEHVSEVKGRDMFVDRYAELLNVRTPAA